MSDLISDSDAKVSTALKSLISATQIEFQSARDRSNQTKLELSNGVVTDQSAINFQAKFARKDARNIDEGAIGKLAIFGSTRKAEILSITDDFVVLLIEGVALADLSSVTLTVDTSWLIEQMLQNLIDQSEGKKKFHSNSALYAIGAMQGTLTSDAIFIESEKLNSNQQEAIEIATSHTPGFIWGPPGTGKTHTLGYLVVELIQRSERVLLASNTNVAVDTALLTTVRALKNHPKIRDGLVVRFGPIQRADVYAEIGELVDVSQIVQRKSGAIIVKLDRVKREQQQIEKKAEVLSKQLSEVSEHRPLLGKLQKLGESKSGHLDRINELDQKILELHKSKDQIDHRIAESQSKSAISRIMSTNLSPKGLTKNRNSMVAEINEAAEIRRTYKSRISSVEKDIKELESRLPDFLMQSNTHDKFNNIETELTALRNEWRKLQEKVVNFNEEIAKISASVLRNASAIFTTAYRTQSSAFDEVGEFETCVIDEASMLPLPLAWITAGKARTRFIAAGDFRQIPPIANSRDPEVEEWYRRSIFECGNIPALVESHSEIENLGMLNMQYRMPQLISDLVSKFAYPEHGLVCLSDDPGGSKYDPSPIVLVDSSGSGAFVEKIESSRANSKHVQGILRVVEGLLSTNDITYDNIVSKLAIVAPYRPQTKRIIDALVPILGEELSKRIVTTVHRMQGNEKDFIILDLVDAPPENIGLIFKGNHLRDQGPRLLNVAISRARKQLFVIGSFEHVSGRARTGHSYRGTQMARFIGLLEESGKKVSLDNLASH